MRYRIKAIFTTKTGKELTRYWRNSRGVTGWLFPQAKDIADTYTAKEAVRMLKDKSRNPAARYSMNPWRSKGTAMKCPVQGCPSNNDAKPYSGLAVCMQSYSGDPEVFRQSIQGCLMGGDRKAEPGIRPNATSLQSQL